MKKFTLVVAGLLLGAGQAQSAMPPVPAVPAQAAASAPDAPVALLLRAAPGTALEYALMSRTQIAGLQLKYVGKPGVSLSAAENSTLTEMNKALGPQITALKQLLGQSVSSSGKQFVRVLPSDPQGNAVLLTTLVTAAIRGGTGSAGQSLPTAGARTTQLTQTTAPDGRVISLKVQTDDPSEQRLYDSMKTDDLLSLLGQNESNLYGLRLAAGQSQTKTQTTDFSALLGGLAEALGGAGASAQIRAKPLTLNVATTFLGQNAAGLLKYQQHYSAEPWTLSMALSSAGGQMTTLSLNMTNWNGQGGLSYRADGLPQTSDLIQHVGVSLLADLPDMPVQLQVSLEMTVSLSSAVR